MVNCYTISTVDMISHCFQNIMIDGKSSSEVWSKTRSVSCKTWKGTFRILIFLKMVINFKSEDSHGHRCFRSVILCGHSLTLKLFMFCPVRQVTIYIATTALLLDAVIYKYMVFLLHVSAFFSHPEGAIQQSIMQ